MTLQKTGIHALGLRYLAMGLMLMDHLYLSLRPGAHWIWLEYFGRMAMPIFCFLIAEGCRHTSNFAGYAVRLFVFGLISELPYNLFLGFFRLPQYQNVMFTLLLGLLALRVLLWGRGRRNWWAYLLSTLVFAFCCYTADILRTDYAGIGVAMVAVFGLTRGMKEERLLQLLCLVFLCGLNGMRCGNLFTNRWFCLLALVPIWCYDGRKGPSNKILQYFAYWFYPVHLLVLGLI